MAKLNISKEELESLEFKANFAYEALKRAVVIDKEYAFTTAESLYKNDFGENLKNLTYPTRHPDLLNKGGNRAKKIEKFILQWVLMYNPSPQKSDRYSIKIEEDPNDGIGGLKTFIDAEDKGDSAKGEVFRLIAHKAEELGKNKRYDLILMAMNYVREKYG